MERFKWDEVTPESPEAVPGVICCVPTKGLKGVRVPS